MKLHVVENWFGGLGRQGPGGGKAAQSYFNCTGLVIFTAPSFSEILTV